MNVSAVSLYLLQLFLSSSAVVGPTRRGLQGVMYFRSIFHRCVDLNEYNQECVLYQFCSQMCVCQLRETGCR